MRTVRCVVCGFMHVSDLYPISTPSYFKNVPIPTPVVSALENYYVQSFLEVPTDFLNHFWIQVTRQAPFRF